MSNKYKYPYKIESLLIFLFSVAFLTKVSANKPGFVYEEKGPEIIVIADPLLPKSQKEAILILPGLLDSKQGRKHQKAAFGQQGFDLYIPEYVDRASYQGTVKKLHEFYQNHELDQYAEVHVFSYILGSWVLNSFIEKYQPQNIASIVYDRSPLQERAPRIMAEKFKFFGKMLFGQVSVDLVGVPYAPMNDTNIQVGVLVESKATWIIKLFKKKAMSYGPINWEKPDIDQAFNDLIYVPHNHNEIYFDFDELGKDILHFFRSGNFRPEAQRNPFSWDPFKKAPQGS